VYGVTTSDSQGTDKKRRLVVQRRFCICAFVTVQTLEICSNKHRATHAPEKA
jgi:hypothetical protein